MFCYSNNGYSMRAVDTNYVAQSGEVLFSDYATLEQLNTAFPLYNSGVPILSKSEKISALKDEYEPQFQELYFSWVAGTVQGDLDAVTEDIAALKAEYTAKLEAVNNG